MYITSTLLDFVQIMLHGLRVPIRDVNGRDILLQTVINRAHYYPLHDVNKLDFEY
jgi:hypothetical protein